MNTETRTTKDQATEIVDTTKEAAQQRVGEVAQKGRGALRSQVDQRSTRAGVQAQSLAGTLRQTASQMRAEGDEQKTRYANAAEQGADRLERVGGYLTQADADEILGKVEDVARQQPWLIAGAGLLAGIAFARFLKASSSERYQRTQLNGEYGQAATWSGPELRPPAFQPATPGLEPADPGMGQRQDEEQWS